MCRQCDELSRPGLARRSLLGALSVGAIAAALPTRFAAAAAPAASTQVAFTADEALERLMEGNARYVGNDMNVRNFAANRASHVKSQAPMASVLSCADSRVGPEFVFDRGPGELFVVRVAGNILEEQGLASLEYGARFLNVPLIFVLGHSNCGAVDAAIAAVKDNAALPGHLPQLIDYLKPAVLAAQKTQPANLLDAAIAENVRETVQQVAGAKPILADLVTAGKVKVVGGVYDIASGKVTLL